MKKILILYWTDRWNSEHSKRIIAVSFELPKLVEVAVNDSNESGESLTGHQILILSSTNQTQGREINYLIEEHDVL